MADTTIFMAAVAATIASEPQTLNPQAEYLHCMHRNPQKDTDKAAGAGKRKATLSWVRMTILSALLCVLI